MKRMIGAALATLALEACQAGAEETEQTKYMKDYYEKACAIEPGWECAVDGTTRQITIKVPDLAPGANYGEEFCTADGGKFPFIVKTMRDTMSALWDQKPGDWTVTFKEDGDEYSCET